MSPVSSFKGPVELSPGFGPRPDISHVLFDFDGTLSLIREGWPKIMVPMFVEMLPARTQENEEESRRLLYDDIMRLNGQQTVYQMIQFAQRVQERGGEPPDPLWYKNEYLRRLDRHISHRIAGLLNG